MNIFKEEIEYRRDRNRFYRFGGWKGLVLKVVIIAIIFTVFKTFSSTHVQNMFWLFGVNSNTTEIIIGE